MCAKRWPCGVHSGEKSRGHISFGGTRTGGHGVCAPVTITLGGTTMSGGHLVKKQVVVAALENKKGERSVMNKNSLCTTTTATH